jgi:hypothetical protein
MLQMRRSRGAFSGFLLMLLGLWGALIPFVGPYFHYAYTPDKAWTYNTGRLWLELLPGAAVFLRRLPPDWSPGAGTPRCSARCWPRWPVPGSPSARF